jgi:hypothetical protein
MTVKPVLSGKSASGNPPVHVHDAVVVIATQEFLRLERDRTGGDLIAALQAIPCPDVDLEPRRGPMPVRDVQL